MPRSFFIAVVFLSASLVSGCVDATEKPEPPPREAGDRLLDLPPGTGKVAQDVALKAIFPPSLTDEASAFVEFRDGRKPRQLFIGDEIELSGDRSATLRGIQQRSVVFEVEGRREELTMPPLTPQGLEPDPEREPEPDR